MRYQLTSRFHFDSIVLCPEDAKAFLEALANPPEPNEKLIEAFNHYHKTNAKVSRRPLAFAVAKQKNQNAESPQGKKKEPKTSLCEFKDYSPKIEQNRVEINLNLRTFSEAQTIAVKKKNGKYTTEHWTAKNKRHTKQKNTVFWSYQEVKYHVKYPCTLTFVRYAPLFLDKHDNLPMSMKWICDQICAEITGEHRPGRADNFEGLTIKYDQVKCKNYAVKIIIEF